MLDFRFEKDINLFLKKIEPSLSNDSTLKNSEIIHSMILSLAKRSQSSRRNPHLMVYGQEQSGEVMIAALQTDPERALLVSMPTNPLMAQALADKLSKASLPGVNAPSTIAESFSEKYCKINFKSHKLVMNLRLFAMNKLNLFKVCPGKPREATLDDLEVILEFFKLFKDEAVPGDPNRTDDELREVLSLGIQNNEFMLWVVNEAPVCMLGTNRESESLKYIAPVYTPQEYRKNGYASNLVANASQKIINSNKKAVLFTDLANKTSNKIYTQLGFEFVCDFKHYEFK